MENQTMNNGNKVKIIIIAAVLAVLAGFLAGGISGFYFYTELKDYVNELKIKYPFIAENINLEEGTKEYTPQTSQEEATINAVKENSPAVVSIVISKDVPVLEQYMYNPWQEFEQFFGTTPYQYGIPQYRQNGTQKQEVGGGTGFIVSKDGMILTNKHVVLEKEAEYTVFTNDGKKYPAKVLALDPAQDLAVIKIEPDEGKEFPIVKLGDSSKLELGQSVIAIGNALGEYKNTISVGVISGLDRTITASGSGISEVLEGIIQTDAAINQGNSGGPLINLKGEVIGINTAMVMDAQSIGFTIPINEAKRDIDQVKSVGKIVYPFLGVRYALVDDAIKQEKELSVDYGALVMKGASGEKAVSSGSPAEKAGIKEGDIILEINGEKITQENSLGSIISKYVPNDKVSVKILRGKEEKTLEVILDERTE